MRISRKEMIDIIGRGESVVIDGRIFTDVESLPSEAVLALGNEEQERVAEESLKRQVAELQAQLDLLNAEGAKTSNKEAKEPEAPKEPAEDESKEPVGTKKTK